MTKFKILETKNNENERRTPPMSNQNYYPTCRFCGRQNLPIDEYASQDDANEEATLKCNCTAAIDYRDEIDRKNKREENAKKLSYCLEDFAAYCESRGTVLGDKIKDILSTAGTLVLDGVIDGAAVKFGRLKATITTNSKGNLVIGFTYADSTKTEVI